MKIRYLLLICICSFWGSKSYSQLIDNFTDGEFYSNPLWIGSSADWVINSSLQLQSNNTNTNSVYYLSTASSIATSAQWEFNTQISFNPSSANYIDVYLTASASDLSANSTTGYFIRIGNTDDEISLYRKDLGGIVFEIIDGINGALNTSNNTIKIKVIRNVLNQWILLRDLSGTGNNYFNEGFVTDASFLNSVFFGILIKQSTASFFQRHFFDNFEVKVFVPDLTPPAILSTTVTSSATIDVLFNETVELLSSELVTNYIVNNGIGIPASSVRDSLNHALLHLVFNGFFFNGSNYQIEINGVADLSGNAISNGVDNFTFYIAKPYDIVIDEIMADPDPQVGLPNNEWIELKNTTPFPINLLGWRIADLTQQSGTLPAYILRPDSFVIVCASSALSAMFIFGNTLAVAGFPLLDNAADGVYLLNTQGNIIHAVNYTNKWYRNELKKEGGWSLEMRDTKNPCTGFSNWEVSTDAKGGTPGKINSADTKNTDNTPPFLMRAYTTDSLHVVLIFDEPLDITQAELITNYQISDGVGRPQTANAIVPVFNKVFLTLNIPLQPYKTYTVIVTSVTDCVGNGLGLKNIKKVGLSSNIDSFDLVINEILFNPKSNGVDYVELYNRTSKIINLKNVYIANRNTAGTISSITHLSIESYLLFPEEFMVVTSDALIVKRDFIAKDIDAFIEVGSMPSYNNDKGDVVILNEQGKIIDELVYNEKWHFKLIDNREGVALERIDYSIVTQNENNWHSAATSVGYGTPSYKNSQYRINLLLEATIVVTPQIVSPDNDGMDDFATIDYSFSTPGYLASITIFDLTGRAVRYLQRNALCGIKGNFRWDGLGEKFEQLSTGIYIIYAEFFNLNGKKIHFKNTIVLARRN